MTKKADVKTCRFVQCRHEDKTINLEDGTFVQNGSAYYHEDCYKDKSNLDFITNYWKHEIDEHVVYSQLRKVLNQLVFKEGYSSDYVAWAIQYCVKNKRQLRHPPGIRYILEDSKIKKAYEDKDKPKVKAGSMKFSAKEKEAETPTFNLKSRRSGFGGILGGG